MSSLQLRYEQHEPNDWWVHFPDGLLVSLKRQQVKDIAEALTQLAIERENHAQVVYIHCKKQHVLTSSFMSITSRLWGKRGKFWKYTL